LTSAILPDVVILAAGKGTRMLSARPKVLHELAGRPLLAHVLQTARSLSARSVVVVYGHGGAAVPAAFRDGGAAFVLQEPQLGTGHALMQALPHLPPDGTTLVLFGDVPLVRGATLTRALSHPGALCLVTAVLDQPFGYGRVLRGASGEVERIVEEQDATPEQKAVREINTGILAAPTHLLAGWLRRLTSDNAQREYYLTDVVGMAIGDGVPVATETVEDTAETEGVNSRAQLARLERVYQRGLAAQLMAAGVSLADPERIDVRGTLRCAQDVHIDVGCVFEGNVSVAENAVIGPYCVIKDSRIGPGAELLPFTHLNGAVIGPDCQVGPFSRLRPGAQLAAGAHVGNFVEMKNTVLGEGSKANHLTYLGDAVIGTKVNVGAGTITCNYDGANKHRTVIEDGAFIGSDTALVAPVTVGRNATIGAGSTITRDAPPDQLTVARGRQVTVPGWKRPIKNKA
jgi:bifunctional UDP-N-acetylglucosamine pyrophosphorylase/glucosamine-1-phosphate N-acetyltransferase